MANIENLKSNTERTPKERKELARKAGLASGAARREKKTMKAMLDYLLEKEIVNKKTGEKMSTKEAICTAIMSKALKGDVKAWSEIRDTIGEKPDAPIININQAVQVNKKDIDEAVNIINELR